MPDLRVELVSQPPMVQLLQLEPTPPPRLNPSTPPILDPNPNPWIKKITKYLKSPQIPKARGKQAAPRKVQHRLHCSPRNFRQNFRTQAAQHLVANHLFNLPHSFHIYNNQGERRLLTPYYWERIVTLGGKLLEIKL